MEQWRAVIDHTQFPSAIYDANGNLLGHYDGYGNEFESDWVAIDQHATRLINPFLAVHEDASYVKLDAAEVSNDDGDGIFELYSSQDEGSFIGLTLENLQEDTLGNNNELMELYTPPDPMLNYFGYNTQEMLPTKKPNELRPWQLYAGMTEFQQSNDIMGEGDQMLPSLLPGTRLPTPKAPDMSYFRKLNKTMTEDLLKKADPWAKQE